MPSRAEAMPYRTYISSPLPLPLRFTLLPSRLPNKSLVPLLYSELNGLPIYLTLSPSHETHMSLLPIILALFPTSPLHIIKLFPVERASLELGGNAPFVDIWVPISLARRVLQSLGVMHFFRSEEKQGAGILSDGVENLLSWEEDGGISHNWLPSPSSIPSSSYSLDALLAVPFLEFEVIPEERCITTSMCRDRKARIVGAGEFEDPSGVRYGAWDKAWEEYLGWAIVAWAEFLSHPPKPPRAKSDPLAKGISSLLSRLPNLSGGHCPTHPISTSDISHMLNVAREPTLLELLWLIINRIFGSSRNLQERRARVQLGVVELVGFQLVDSFTRQQRKKSDGCETQIEVRRASPSSFPDVDLGIEPVWVHPTTTLEEHGDLDKETSGWWIYACSALAAILAIFMGISYL